MTANADASLAQSDSSFDVIIVGAGAAGCIAAHELTQGGLRVLLLDAGPEVEPNHDGSSERPGLNLINRVWLGLRGQAVQARCFACTPATHQLYVNDRDNPYSTPGGKPFNWFRGRQVGGRLHTWGRVAPRFSDWELKPSTYGAAGIDWPIGHEDLAPFYSHVERLLGVHGCAEGMPQRPDGEFIAPRPLNSAEERVRHAVAARWPTRRFVAAPVVQHRPNPVPLPLSAAIRTGRLTLRPNAVVKRVCMERGGTKARGIEFIDRVSGRSEEVHGRVVVLCASAIESVRILLNSASEDHPDGLGNSSGTLGRYLMDHCMVAMSGDVAEPLASGGAPHDTDNDASDHAGAFLYMPGFRNITERPTGPYHGSFSILGSVGRSGPGFFFIGFGDMVPVAHNCVRLDTARTDAWGIPIAHVSCAHSPADRALVADLAETMRAIAEVAGLRPHPPLGDVSSLRGRALYASLWKHVVTTDGAFHPGSAIHEMGGARMGNDPRTSLLNPHNQSWDVSNLFVTDGACFVSSGHQAHTLTMMAITARACDFILAQRRAGVL